MTKQSKKLELVWINQEELFHLQLPRYVGSGELTLIDQWLTYIFFFHFILIRKQKLHPHWSLRFGDYMCYCWVKKQNRNTRNKKIYINLAIKGAHTRGESP